MDHPESPGSQAETIDLAEIAAAAMRQLQQMQKEYPLVLEDASEFTSFPNGLPQEVRELEDKVNIDQLTGLPNGNVLQDTYTRMQESASYERRRIGEVDPGTNSYMALIDLDGFKQQNDTYGHAAGDAVLEQVAGIFKACLRENDLVTRLHGDEFALILFRSGPESTFAKLDEIRAAVETQTAVSTSIGYAEINLDNDLETTLKQADTAMYAAKEKGRNQAILYSSDMTTNNLE